jgi:hypothetical protein
MKIRTLRRIKFWSPVVVAIGLMTIVINEYAKPWIAGELYREDYKRLALECDRVMHDEVVLRDRVLDEEKKKLMMVSADVGLLACHEYDKLRKRMLIMGMTDEQLALLGLEALDIEMIPVSKMADPHRMPRF